MSDRFGPDYYTKTAAILSVSAEVWEDMIDYKRIWRRWTHPWEFFDAVPLPEIELFPRWAAAQARWWAARGRLATRLQRLAGIVGGAPWLTDNDGPGC